MTKLKRINRRRPYLNVLDFLVEERSFLLMMLVGLALAQILVNYGQAAMWLGFTVSAYAAVANDSIQSLGTFIESNKDKRWWVMWLFVGTIFLMTVTFSWVYFDGDVTFQRLLDSNGNSRYPHPSSFSFFQVAAPMVLLIMTRLRMPVSTTFLMLSVFSADSAGIWSMVTKSMSGYVMAFVLSFVIWYSSYELIRKFFKQRKTHIAWSIAQWVISGTLWAVWVMQDGANIAVFLPRQQSLPEFIVFASVIFAGLGFLFYLRGDKIQGVVSEKIRMSDIRSATLVDFTFVLLLIYKLFISTVPMSTTWVFLGVIGGREIAVNLARTKKGRKHIKKSGRKIFRDLSSALLGLIISVVMASGANPAIREEIMEALRRYFDW